MSLLPTDELLEFALEIAGGAGAITLRHFRQGSAPETKADGSFVTVADREAEAFLRERISQAYPDDAILGEEFGLCKGSSGRRWILDPIDGTFSFVHGVPLYGVLVGLEIDGSPTVGAAVFPALDEIVWAAIGRGCFHNGVRARVSSTEALDRALVLVTDLLAAPEALRAGAERVQQRAQSRRGWGDAYGHALVATGQADLMLDPEMSVWDCAALFPIVTEAGGTFTDWSGKPTIDGGSAVSTNGALFDQVITALRETPS